MDRPVNFSTQDYIIIIVLQGDKCVRRVMKIK
jgi:hypothetical protein